MGSMKEAVLFLIALVHLSTANTNDINIFHERTAVRNFENKIRVPVTLRLNNAYHEDIVVNVTVGELEGIEDVLKAEAGVDFSTDGFPKQVTIPAGQTSAQFEVRVINDLIVERDEQFQVSFTYSGGQPGVVVRPGFDEAMITIENDDALRVMFEKNMYLVREDVGNLSYRLTASKTASFSYEVNVTAVDGTAKCGLDYDTPVAMTSANVRPVAKCSYSLNVVIPAGEVAGSGVVAIINDTVHEGQQEFYFYLSVSPEFRRRRILVDNPRRMRVTVQIEDDDELSVFFKPALYSVPEGDILQIVLQTNNTFDVPFTIDVTIVEGTAVDSSNYEGRSYQVVFNVTTQTGTLVVHTEMDNIIENDEDFTAVLSVPAGLPRVFEGTPSEATVTILDQTTAEVYFDPATYNVTEGQPADIILRLTRDVDPTVTIIMVVEIMHGPRDASDYTGGVLTTAFRGNSTAVVPVPTLPDNIVEGDESFTAAILVPVDATMAYRVRSGTPATATVVITDDDNMTVFFNSTFHSVPEGENQVLVLKADNPFEVSFIAIVTLVDSTAVAPGDYEDRSYQVVFNITTQTGTLVVHTETDNIIENDEDFTAVLSVPGDLQRVFEGTPSEATVTILDQTTAEVYFDPATYNVTEGQPADLILRLTRDVDPTVTIIMVVQIMQGPRNCLDYTSSLLTAVFRGNSTAVVPVPTLPDYIVEGEESFTAAILVPVDATMAYRVTRGSPARATVMIIDNDNPLCTFQHCTKNRAALCTVVGADGNCTNQLTSCKACYFAREKRPLPNKCSTNHRNYSCAGLTGLDLKECLQTWGKCVNQTFKDVHGKIPRRLRKKRFFKCPEFPCN